MKPHGPKYLAWPLLAWLLWLCASSAWALPGGPTFAQFFNTHSNPMLVINPASGQIVDANPAAVRFYGYPRPQLRQMTIQQINALTPEQVAAERELASTEGRNFFIFRHRLASGELRTVEVYSHPYAFNDLTLLISVIHDITPGRHQSVDLWHYQQGLEDKVAIQTATIEAARRWQVLTLMLAVLAQAAVIVWLLLVLRQRKRLAAERHTLQAHNQDLAHLGQALSHHFLEPTRRLRSFAQRLQGKPELALDDDSRLALRFIDEQSSRLSNLVRDVQRYLLLDQSPPEHASGADALAALRAALEPLQDELAGCTLRLPEQTVQVAMDSQRLSEVFRILLDNASRYRHPERPLLIEVRFERLPTGWARLSLSDNGSGIPAPYRQQVFELFSRLVGSEIPGSGMGLALASKMLHSVHGRVRIENGLDGGACFVIELPLKSSP